MDSSPLFRGEDSTRISGEEMNECKRSYYSASSHLIDRDILLCPRARKGPLFMPIIVMITSGISLEHLFMSLWTVSSPLFTPDVDPFIFSASVTNHWIEWRHQLLGLLLSKVSNCSTYAQHQFFWSSLFIESFRISFIPPFHASFSTENSLSLSLSSSSCESVLPSSDIHLLSCKQLLTISSFK